MNLSRRSEDFLQNLRLYLFSSGKNETEIEDIVGELEDHLYEAEAKGKSLDDIIGKTPKEYMKQISNELQFDKRVLMKYIPMIILGVYAYSLIGDAIRGGIVYSILEVIGEAVILLFYLFVIIVTFRIAASTNSKIKEYILFGIQGFVPVTLFISLEFLDQYYKTPTIEFSSTGNIIAIVVAIFVFIIISLWGKTWISIILPFAMFLPEILINRMTLEENTKLILTGWIVPLSVGICLLIFILLEKRKEKR